jgi:hypothetical protein
MGGIEVDDNDKSCIRVVRKALEKLLQRMDAARRRPNADGRKALGRRVAVLGGRG